MTALLTRTIGPKEKVAAAWLFCTMRLPRSPYGMAIKWTAVDETSLLKYTLLALMCRQRAMKKMKAPWSLCGSCVSE